jgi:hypothetical protein
MNEIEKKADDLNASIVKARGELFSLFMLMEKNGMDIQVLNEIRDLLTDAELASRNIPGVIPDVEIY